jgi:hypothetical protein
MFILIDVLGRASLEGHITIISYKLVSKKIWQNINMSLQCVNFNVIL